MNIMTPKELIATLSQYKEDELLLVTWWSQEDVEMCLEDEDITSDKAEQVWNDIISDLDNQASDYAISSVNDTLYDLVNKQTEEA